MIPIPRAGTFRGVQGVEQALEVNGVEEIRITARPDQQLVPLPEGVSYLGFIFARGASPEEAVSAIRAAHARLRFHVDAPLSLVGEPLSRIVRR